jgi:hypothetical protein
MRQPELGGPRVEGRAIRGQSSLHSVTRYPTHTLSAFTIRCTRSWAYIAVPFNADSQKQTNRVARIHRRPTLRDIIFIFEVAI